MASLITCPHCGIRPKEEFTIRGDATPVRPDAGAPDEVWLAYTYLRENPKGRIREMWHHTSGCRRFLVVERDNATHEVFAVTDVAALGEAAE